MVIIGYTNSYCKKTADYDKDGGGRVESSLVVSNVSDLLCGLIPRLKHSLDSGSRTGIEKLLQN